MSSPTLIRTVCKAMERIAPLRLAEKWDNVGLMLESPVQDAARKLVLLTIDLTTAVASEAIGHPTGVGVIVAYHPPIFKPALSAITLANPIQASLLHCAAAGVSIYSPHTALDSVWGGINDWLAYGALGRAGVTEEEENTGRSMGAGHVESLGAHKLSPETGKSEGGEGRLAMMDESIKLNALVDRIKRFLGLEYVQVGYAAGSKLGESDVKTVAVCAGSGGSLLLGRDADVYFTGEMSHHEVLAAVADGRHVILCGHTNTERGYLPILAKKLEKELNSEVQVVISQSDKHPLQVV